VDNKVSTGSYEILKYNKYIILRLIGDISDAQAERYSQETLSDIAMSDLDLIVNCDYLTALSPAWQRALVNTEQAIRRIPKKMKLILVTPTIKSVLDSSGLSRTFQFKKNLRDALLDLGHVNKKTLDVGFINPFLEAVVRVLEIQAEFKASAGAIFIKKDTTELSGDISGVIGLVSDSFNGNVIITFPEQTFLSIMSKMHREKYTVIDKENSDGAGELTNMIFGQAKITLNEQGYGIRTALPSVTIGKGHHFSAGKQGPVIIVPFKSEMGDFYVEICLSDIDQPA
jgi:chemotaxis protein CheX